ncbi:MAG: hypothetical protein ACQESH_05505, partial [Campylobacterota bacterium]
MEKIYRVGLEMVRELDRRSKQTQLLSSEYMDNLEDAILAKKYEAVVKLLRQRYDDLELEVVHHYLKNYSVTSPSSNGSTTDKKTIKGKNMSKEFENFDAKKEAEKLSDGLSFMNLEPSEEEKELAKINKLSSEYREDLEELRK